MEWVWYLNDDSNSFSRLYTEGMFENRNEVLTSFAEWALEDPSPENIEWFFKVTSGTSKTVAAILNATGFYLDYSEDLIALEGKIPLLYVVSEEDEKVAGDWIKKHTPYATVVFRGKHLFFWERAAEFNQILDEFLSGIEAR